MIKGRVEEDFITTILLFIAPVLSQPAYFLRFIYNRSDLLLVKDISTLEEVMLKESDVIVIWSAQLWVHYTERLWRRGNSL